MPSTLLKLGCRRSCFWHATSTQEVLCFKKTYCWNRPKAGRQGKYIFPSSSFSLQINSPECYSFIPFRYWCNDRSYKPKNAHMQSPLFYYLKKVWFILYWPIVLVGRVFSNGLGDHGSIPGRVILKTLKMVLDASLLNTQHYKIRIKGKVEQSSNRCCS